MAKKNTAPAEPVADAEPVPHEPRDPAAVIGLDHGRTGQYEYRDFAQPSGCARVLTVNGAYYEHCANDVDGVWLYRHSHI